MNKQLLNLLIPYLSFKDLYPLLLVSKTFHKIFDSNRVWFKIVNDHNIYWRWDDYDEQDTGGTTIRGILSSLYSGASTYLSKDRTQLIDPKGLVKWAVYQDRKYPYHVCSYSDFMISHYQSDHSSDDDIEYDD